MDDGQSQESQARRTDSCARRKHGGMIRDDSIGNGTGTGICERLAREVRGNRCLTPRGFCDFGSSPLLERAWCSTERRRARQQANRYLRCVVIAVMRRVVVAKSSGLGSRVIPLCVAAGVDTYENPCLYQRRSKLSEFAR